jgi:hypothetical protein
MMKQNIDRVSEAAGAQLRLVVRFETGRRTASRPDVARLLLPGAGVSTQR